MLNSGYTPGIQELKKIVHSAEIQVMKRDTMEIHYGEVIDLD